MRRSILVTTLLVVISLSAVGCAPWATYPPVEHTSKLVNPRFEPIPTIIADAIRYTHDQYGTVEQPVFNLPEGTPVKVYDMVQAKIEGSRPMTIDDSRAYHVTAVRTRGPEAEADVIVPRADGLHELVTVRFKQKFAKGYQVASARQWRVRVEPPAAHYQPPTETARGTTGETTDMANVDAEAEAAGAGE